MPDHKDKPDQQAQAGHTVNGKHTAPGHAVHYTSSDGQQHNATIDHVAATGHANLTTHDGRQFTSVPHSAMGGAHTWDHAPSDE